MESYIEIIPSPQPKGLSSKLLKSLLVFVICVKRIIIIKIRNKIRPTLAAVSRIKSLDKVVGIFINEY